MGRTTQLSRCGRGISIDDAPGGDRPRCSMGRTTQLSRCGRGISIDDAPGGDRRDADHLDPRRLADDSIPCRQSGQRGWVQRTSSDPRRLGDDSVPSRQSGQRDWAQRTSSANGRTRRSTTAHVTSACATRVRVSGTAPSNAPARLGVQIPSLPAGASYNTEEHTRTSATQRGKQRTAPCMDNDGVDGGTARGTCSSVTDGAGTHVSSEIRTRIPDPDVQQSHSSMSPG